MGQLWTNYTSQHNGGAERAHPTEKPVELLREIIRRWVPEHAIVVDRFGGSGTTLMACDAERRTAYLIEIDPGYCDVMIKRWEKIAGGTAKHLRPKAA